MKPEKVDKVQVLERYRGAIQRASLICDACRSETDYDATTCATCGAPFRTGFRRSEVTH